MTGATRVCAICKQPKPVEDFYLRGATPMDRCKACHIARVQRRTHERQIEIERKARRKMTEIPKVRIIETTDGLRLATVKEACRYGAFSTTKCYELINSKRIKAVKLDGRTLVDLDSVDAMFRSLPDAAEAMKAAKPIL